MFKFLSNTSGKFITVGICIFCYYQLNKWYDKVSDTIEKLLDKGQTNPDSTMYLWVKLLNDDMIINIINSIIYVIIFWAGLKIIATMYSNMLALSEIRKITKKNNLFNI